MDEHRNTILILLLILGALLFIIYSTEQSLQTMRDEVSEEREFSEMLFKEYEDLVRRNELLRGKVFTLHENLTFTSQQVGACIAGEQYQVNFSPQKRVVLDDVIFRDDSVIVNVDDIIPGIVSPSGSMIPFLGTESIVLEIKPESHTEIYPGDVIVYEQNKNRIIHRVMRVGWDENGWFAITKGDNNPAEDEQKVRFSRIKGVVVGIIY